LTFRLDGISFFPKGQRMPINPGDNLATYEILSQIGAGGMGEVYRARDTKLGREVAIKVLPEAFAKDVERLARFEREARILASLNHPNIATIHGLELSGTTRFLVMELVPGETLADRIKRGAIPVDEALPLFRQVAEGLAAAHEEGVVHRDLKPANIKLTPDDKVKVLDFGLAKATIGTPSSDLSESPTITRAATETGVILGTAGYMSPEQARGKTVDKRTDIWAFGCCLYEALTGRVTFQGDTLSDTIASVLRQDPDWQALPETTPRSIRRLLARCLQKDPRRRFRDAWDVRVEIGEAEPAVTPAKAIGAQRARRTMPWVAALVFALLATAIGIWSWISPGPSSTGAVTRLRLPTPPLAEWFRMLAISPDGTRLAFIGELNGTTQIFLRSLDRLEAKPMEGTEGALINVFFSPDGEWVGFFADDKLKKVSVAGGAPVTLCDAPRAFHAAWAPDDRIYFEEYAHVRGRVLSVSAAGGTPQAVSTPEEVSHRPLEVLPGGKALLIAVARNTWDGFEGLEIGAFSLETGEYRTLIERAHRGSYARTGHLVFSRAGTLLAAPFDVGRLEVTGPAVPVLEGLPGPFGRPFRISENGTLVYVPQRTEPGGTLVWVNREGEARPVTDVRRGYQQLRISPDGQRIAVEILWEGNYDIWIYDIPRGTLTRLTVAESLEGIPEWSSDGKRVAFFSDRDPPGVYWKPIDGSGPTERLTDAGDHPESWSPDGRVLAFGKGDDLWMLPMEGERKPEPFLDTPFRELGASFSPDGQWIAYHSDESGRWEVYVRAYSGPGGKWQLSTHGGLFAVWSPDGREIFYRTEDKKVMVVPLQLTPEFRAGKPKMLFEDRFVYINHRWRNYDITPDGQRFLMVEGAEEGPPTEIVVVFNWFEELKRRVPTE
jgi:serine/threonine-protein kinase